MLQPESSCFFTPPTFSSWHTVMWHCTDTKSSFFLSKNTSFFSPQVEQVLRFSFGFVAKCLFGADSAWYPVATFTLQLKSPSFGSRTRRHPILTSWQSCLIAQQLFLHSVIACNAWWDRRVVRSKCMEAMIQRPQPFTYFFTNRISCEI